MNTKQMVFLLVAVLSLAIVFAGCEGPTGPAGESIEGPPGEDGMAIVRHSSEFPGEDDESYSGLGSNTTIWMEGDFIQGTREFLIGEYLLGVEIEIPLESTTLSSPGKVDFDLIINGDTIDNFTVYPGDNAIHIETKTYTAFSDEIAILLEITEDVQSGYGAITIDPENLPGELALTIGEVVGP